MAVSPTSIGNEGRDVPDELAIFQERDSASQQKFLNEFARTRSSYNSDGLNQTTVSAAAT